MLSLLHFGLQIKDGLKLQKPKKYEPSYQILMTSLNYLHPVLGDEYTVTIHNDDNHTYKDDQPAYTLELETPTRKKEINYITPTRDSVEPGLGLLTEAYYVNSSNRKDDLQYSRLGKTSPSVHISLLRLLQRFEGFFAEKYTLSITQSPERGQHGVNLEVHLRTHSDRNGQTILTISENTSDVSVSIEYQALSSVYNNLKKQTDNAKADP